MQKYYLSSKKWRLTLSLFVIMFCGGILPVHSFSPTDYFVKVVDKWGYPIEGATVLFNNDWSLTTNENGEIIFFEDLGFLRSFSISIGKYNPSWQYEEYSFDCDPSQSLEDLVEYIEGSGIYLDVDWSEYYGNFIDVYIITVDYNSYYAWFYEDVLAGYVKDTDGNYISDAKVSLWGYNDNSSKGMAFMKQSKTKINGAPQVNSTLLLSATTDQNGYYMMEGDVSLLYPYSSFYISIEAEGYEPYYIAPNELNDNIFVLEKENDVSEDAGLVDGINSVKAGASVAKHLNMSGVEIAPNAKGLHIVNGKKILVK